MLRKYLTRDRLILGGFSDEEGMLQLNLNEWRELARQMEEEELVQGSSDGKDHDPF